MLKLLLLVCVALQLAFSAPLSDDLLIELPDGEVQGTTYVTDNNKTYFGFQGIPYATPPTGVLRFEAPQLPKPWSGIWDATRDSSACLSISRAPNESEDCLYINVYTPDVKPTEKLPVMFWIYGGGFTTGSSSKSIYGPDFIIEKDVILVSFNYRLGPFGFLSTGDAVIPGNVGLKDQNLALKWTHDNIEYFGGDSEKITIFGQSAGAASTGLHLLSTQSAGLFRAAIVESGSALTVWSIDLNPKSYAVSLVEALNGDNYENETQKLKDFLAEKTSEEILDATVSLAANGQQAWPVIEVEHENAFITWSPYELLASGRFNQVPIIIGICSEESLYFLKDLSNARQFAAAIDADPSLLIPTDFRPNDTYVKTVIKGVHDIYLEDGEKFSNNLVALAKLYTDNAFARGVIKHGEIAAGYVKVYLYEFAYYGRVITEAFIDGAEKAGHSAELPFIFKFMGLSETTDPADLLTQSRMTTLWTNFAKFFKIIFSDIMKDRETVTWGKFRTIIVTFLHTTKFVPNGFISDSGILIPQMFEFVLKVGLNPTPEPFELLNNITWPNIIPIAPLDLKYLNINSTVDLRSNPKGETYKGWVHLYEKYAWRPFITY